MDLNTLSGLLDISGDTLLGLLDISGHDADGYDGDSHDGYDGSDGDAILGELEGLFRRKKRKMSPMQKAILAKKVQDGTLVKNMAPIAERRLSIGFVSNGAIAANGTQPITVQPQWAFKGQRLSIPSALVNFFDIASVQIGAINQFPSPGAQPASSFADVAVGDNMEMDTCNLGQLITVSVINTDPGAAHTFKASLFGKAIITAACR
jgi:hypothetical protein